MRAACLALALCTALLPGCRAFVATHYIPGDDGKWHAACRLWGSTMLMQGETVAACMVPMQSDSDVPTGLTTEDSVAMATAKGWEDAARGGDVIEGPDKSVDGTHDAEQVVTSAGMVQLPVVGSSGIAFAQRDDDIGIETASVIRWAAAMWGAVEIAGSLFGFLEKDSANALAGDLAVEETKQVEIMTLDAAPMDAGIAP